METITKKNYITEQDVEHFKIYVQELVSGESENPYIPKDSLDRIESMLIDWITQKSMRREEMALLARELKTISRFNFKDDIYRGVKVLVGETITSNDIESNFKNNIAISFTDYLPIAQNFAGIKSIDFDINEEVLDKLTGSFLCKASICEEGVFAFDEFMVFYIDISENLKLVSEMESFVGENEKIVSHYEIKDFSIEFFKQQPIPLIPKTV